MEATFESDGGHPTWVYVEDAQGRTELNPLTRDFMAIERPAGCASAPGSATDLQSEPVSWLGGGNEHRWADAEGCPVRVDVIGQYPGLSIADGST